MTDLIDSKTGDPWASPLPDWQPTGESTDAIGQDSDGCWMVWTLGSTHLWEIRWPNIHWTRLPGEGRSRFVGDTDQQMLTRVDRWPVVGGTQLVWFDDPDHPSAIEQWRQSSTIRHIERVIPVAG